jgi:hypothetical protein
MRYSCEFVQNSDAVDCACILLMLLLLYTLSQCTLNNSTAAQGGALYGADASNILINGSSFTSNHGDTAGATVTTCNMTILNSVFDSNTATEQAGAIDIGSGLVVNATRDVLIQNTTFTSNSAYSGAAITSETPATANTTLIQVCCVVYHATMLTHDCFMIANCSRL